MGSEMCIRDRSTRKPAGGGTARTIHRTHQVSRAWAPAAAGAARNRAYGPGMLLADRGTEGVNPFPAAEIRKCWTDARPLVSRPPGGSRRPQKHSRVARDPRNPFRDSNIWVARRDFGASPHSLHLWRKADRIRLMCKAWAIYVAPATATPPHGTVPPTGAVARPPEDARFAAPRPLARPAKRPAVTMVRSRHRLT